MANTIVFCLLVLISLCLGEGDGTKTGQEQPCSLSPTPLLSCCSDHSMPTLLVGRVHKELNLAYLQDVTCPRPVWNVAEVTEPSLEYIYLL